MTKDLVVSIIMSYAWRMNEHEAIRQVVEIAGGQSALARKLGTTQSHVSRWVNLDCRVSAPYALKCHFITQGKVSAHDLRPDLYPPMYVAIADISFRDVPA